MTMDPLAATAITFPNDPLKERSGETVYHQFARVRRARLVAEAEAKALKDQEVNLAKVVLDQFAEDGLAKVTLEDGATVHMIQNMRHEALADTDAIVATLKGSATYGWLVQERVNAQQLWAALREYNEGRPKTAEAATPPELSQVIRARYEVTVGLSGGHK